MVAIFLVLLKNICTDFHSGYTNLHSHKDIISVSIHFYTIIIYNGYSDQDETESQCSFDVQSPDG
jgi:hypothetical protein